MPESPQVEQITELFARCMLTLQTTAQPDWLHLDLTLAQIKVLLVLLWRDSLTVSEVAEQLGVGQPTASHLVDRLVRAGWVLRQENPADRRYTLVQLSEQGRGMIERLHQGRLEQLRTCLRHLSPDELICVQQGLQTLAQALQAWPLSCDLGPTRSLRTSKGHNQVSGIAEEETEE